MSRVFSSDIAEVVRARRTVLAHLRAWGYEDEVEPMALAVGDLLTNGVVHGRRLVDVSLTAEDGVIRVAVADHGACHRGLVQARWIAVAGACNRSTSRGAEPMPAQGGSRTPVSTCRSEGRSWS